MRPTARTLRLAWAWLGLGVAAALWSALRVPFEAAGGLGLVLLLADAIALTRREAPTLTRRIPHTMAIGERYEITLGFTSDRHERILVHDDAPDTGQSEGLPARLTLQPARPTVLGYRFRPMQRGTQRFAPTRVLLSGPLGLLEQQRRLGEAYAARVYPNFRRVAAFAAPGEASLYQGVQLQRKRGQGLEFYQLREYREGDSPREIDWKAVARRQQLVSREYRSEQNQNVIFLLDCGRRMRAHDGELTLLDQSLNSLLLLSYVALRQGDSVGVLTFSGEQRWLAPVRGPAGLNRVLQTVYDLDSSPQPSDFEEAVARLSARQRRRALIVVLTNLGDHDASSLRDSLLSLRSRHLVLVASMRDPELGAQLDAAPDSSEDGLRLLSTLAYLDARRHTRTRLSSAGIHTLESEPAALPQQLVESYMQIKRAGRL